MMRFSRWLPILMAVLMVPACGMRKQAAEKALTDVELAYAQIVDQARNVAPDEAQAIEAGIAAAKGELAKGNADAVLAAAKDLDAKVKTLAESLPDLQTKLQADWKDLTNSVPGALAMLRKKLDDLGRPPAGMPGREVFDATTAQLAPLGEKWDEATSLFVSGKLAQAVSMGGEVKGEVVKLITGLQTGS
ncbi:MAG TPA: hypothetical protein VI504_11575 [Candidatus Eisenbacteria bacterium]|jgi:hypothetical protein